MSPIVAQFALIGALSDLLEAIAHMPESAVEKHKLTDAYMAAQEVVNDIMKEKDK